MKKFKQKTITCSLIFIAIILLNACQVKKSESSNMLEHKYAGAKIKKQFSGWRFVKSIDFSKDGYDVGYNFDNINEPSLRGTWYVYPAGKNLSEEDLVAHTKDVMSAAISQYDSYKIILSDVGTYTRDGKVYPSCFSVINFEKSGYRYTTFVVVMYVKNWYVKNRITLLEDAFKANEKEVQDFIKNTPLPEKEYNRI